MAPVDANIRVVFNDYPDPDSIGGGDFVLTTGVFYYTGTYAVDLLGKAVIFRPASLLRSNLGYTVTTAPPLQSLSGCPTTKKQTNFRTSNFAAGVPPPPIVPFSGVQPILASRCGGSSCHRQAESEGGGCLTSPAAGLSLCDDEAVDAVVGIPSRQVSRLLLVAPNDSARSYLFRKLIPTSPSGGPIPTVLGQRDPPDAPLSATELAQIAAWIDTGARR